jgi:hypothetical protein
VIGDLLRDEETLSRVLRRRLLRCMIRATAVLNACSRGKDLRIEEIRAASALLRLAPRLLVESSHGDQEEDYLMSAEMWTVEKRLTGEVLMPYESREEAADTWRYVFDKNGPREGLFRTREEAAEYGRFRFDNIEKLSAERKRRWEAGESEPYVYRTE